MPQKQTKKQHRQAQPSGNFRKPLARWWQASSSPGEMGPNLSLASSALLGISAFLQQLRDPQPKRYNDAIPILNSRGPQSHSSSNRGCNTSPLPLNDWAFMEELELFYEC